MPDPATICPGWRDRPPLTYSVLVSGGAFVSTSRLPDRARDVSAEDGGEDPLRRTFVEEVAAESETAGPSGLREGIALTSFMNALLGGEVFVRVEQDGSGADVRAALAAHFPDVDDAAAGVRSPPPDAWLATARERGHDLVLVVRRIEDGPVEDQGINERWPVTAFTWLVLGVGALIPDRTFESRATLYATLHEVYTGRELTRVTLSGGPVELALIDRGSLWGLVQSILIPPFWVASDPERVVGRVRSAASRRMSSLLARRIKSVVTEQELEAASALAFEAAAEGETGLRIGVRSREGLRLLRARLDGEVVATPEFEDFERRLLRSEVFDEPSQEFRYSAVWTPAKTPDEGAILQLLARTIAGRAASTTRRFGEP